MRELDDDASITTLTIPGSHDAGTAYGCKNPIARMYARCQYWNIESQLMMGIRFLDIRLKADYQDQKLKVYHGPCDQQLEFDQVLATVGLFLEINPSEFIVMRITEEGKIKTQDVYTCVSKAEKWHLIKQQFAKARKDPSDEILYFNYTSANGLMNLKCGYPNFATPKAYARFMIPHLETFLIKCT